ncbi:MAG: hypothetical protein WAT17_02345 [Candidatus Saccharimonadales bacterium]|jgi:hypothetical protein
MDLRSQQRVHAQPRQDVPVATSFDAAPAAPAQPYAKARGTKKTKLKKPVVYGVAAVLALGVLGLAVKGATSLTGASGVLGASTSGPSISQGKYQALFLTNGQVYFGKIVGLTGDTVTMKDIYYLQQGVQNQEKKDDAASSQLQLTKLGKELHGPEDAMYIERSQVLFWENLKDDSEVVKNIKLEKQQTNQ